MNAHVIHVPTPKTGGVIKCLSVRQPFAELIALGRKKIELRSRQDGRAFTTYRGPVLICSGVAWDAFGCQHFGKIGQRGVAVCLVWLVDCRPMKPGDWPKAWPGPPSAGSWPDVDGRQALVLRAAKRVEPIPVKGALGLVTLDPSIAVRLFGHT